MKKTRTELFEESQMSMSDKRLVDVIESQIEQLAKTGGRSHVMSVPPKVTDTDMIFSELVRRYKEKINLE